MSFSREATGSSPSSPALSSLPAQARADAGFTLAELLVSMGVVAVLAALLLPALGVAKRRVKVIQCLSHQRQFGLAWQMYADDHAGRLLPNRGGPRVPLGETWVEGWLGLPGSDCTNEVFLRGSLLGGYLRDAKLWRCPASRPVTVGGVTQLRARTVSMNAFMGSTETNLAVPVFHRTGDIVAPGPAGTLVFVDERPETINDGTFSVMWEMDLNVPDGWVLRDKPTVAHGAGAALVFADGHAEMRRWQDARTLNPPRDDASMPGNEDVRWLYEHSAPAPVKQPPKP